MGRGGMCWRTGGFGYLGHTPHAGRSLARNNAIHFLPLHAYEQVSLGGSQSFR